MAAFEKCCCCSLRAGTAFIGMLGLVASGGGGVACVLVVTAKDLAGLLQTGYNTYYYLEHPVQNYGPNSTLSGPRDLGLKDPTLMYVEWVVLALLVYLFAATVSNALLALSTFRETLWMMLPWMVVQWVTILLTITLFALVLWHELVAMPRYWWAVMFMVSVVILMVMSFVLVLSYYQSVKEREAPELFTGAEMVHRHMWLSQKGKYFD